MAPPLYQRFIPPKPAQAAAVAPAPSPQAEVKHAETKSQVEKSQKRKRDDGKDAKPKRKRKRPRTAAEDSSSSSSSSSSSDSDPAPNTPNLQTQDADEDELGDGDTIADRPVEPVKQKRKKRSEEEAEARKEKKKKKRKEVEIMDVDVRDGDAEDDDSKHTAVLKKFEKSIKKADLTRKTRKDEDSEMEETEEPELHDLTPLPQPKQVLSAKYIPAFSTLPSWLADPTTVHSDAITPFSELPIDKRVVQHLADKGYTNAFAVQSAVLPLLLRGPRKYYGDVCVSAPTGSGKTLAYILPMVESLKGTMNTSLRGLIIVPTRELVAQAKEVAEMCASGTGLKIGIAVGSQTIRSEQEMLVKRGQKYDVEAAKQWNQRAMKRNISGSEDDEDEINDALSCLPYHVPEYLSKVDILICTPGRLVDHIRTTRGFALNDIKWLIIDEADRLLEQGFQEWVSILVKSLEPKISQALSLASEPTPIQKVVCSATMTRDLSKLGSLKLHRPKLVAVVNDNGLLEDSEDDDTGKPNDGGEFVLPSKLREFVVPAGDGSDKPLYLLRLLQTHILSDMDGSINGRLALDTDTDDNSLSDSSSDVSSISDESDDDTEASSRSESPRSRPARITSPAASNTARKNNVLIFTASTTSATRLSSLLSSLAPSYASLTATLTKTSASSSTIRKFNAGKLRIIIATDRASRGLDLTNLTHVINYDVPRSVGGYVHRVGRTARAGRTGQAWTLLESKEARWFWKESGIGKGEALKRDQTVERKNTKVEELEGMRAAYEKALEGLKEKVMGKG